MVPVGLAGITTVRSGIVVPFDETMMSSAKGSRIVDENRIIACCPVRCRACVAAAAQLQGPDHPGVRPAQDRHLRQAPYPARRGATLSRNNTRATRTAAPQAHAPPSMTVIGLVCAAPSPAEARQQLCPLGLSSLVLVCAAPTPRPPLVQPLPRKLYSSSSFVSIIHGQRHQFFCCF